MNWLFEQFIERPLAALTSSIEILGEGLETGQSIDAIVGRVIHTMSCPAGGAGQSDSPTIEEREGKS